MQDEFDSTKFYLQKNYFIFIINLSEKGVRVIPSIFMKGILKNIEEELLNKGLTNINFVNHINGDLYFIQTDTNTYTYDYKEKTLEKSEEFDTNKGKTCCPFSNEEKSKVAEENLNLIHYVIRGFSNIDIEYEELESVGYIGLAKALNSFDKMKGIRFSTFAINCIMNEVLFFLRKERKHLTNISLSSELHFDNDGKVVTIEDTLEDEKSREFGIDYNLIQKEKQEMLLDAISVLNDEEQYIMISRYGLNGMKVKTQKQLANELNMSQANISKIQRSCLKRLRFNLQKKANR